MSYYLENWQNAINEMKYSNTYKCAWGHAILELVYNQDINVSTLSLKFNDISEIIFRYYWNQIVILRVWQGPIKQKPRVQKLIEEIFDKSDAKRTDYKKMRFEIVREQLLESGLYLNVINDISNILLIDVSTRFMNIDRQSSRIYFLNKETKEIIFTKDEAVEIKKNAVRLSKEISKKWGEQICKFNLSKIEEIQNNRVIFKEKILHQLKIESLDVVDDKLSDPMLNIFQFMISKSKIHEIEDTKLEIEIRKNDFILDPKSKSVLAGSLNNGKNYSLGVNKNLHETIINIIGEYNIITKFKLVQELISHGYTDEELIISIIHKLIEDRVVHYTSLGYQLLRNDIFGFVNGISDARKRKILSDRLSGMTLEQIAKIHNLTRERVRQLVSDILKNRVPIIEDRYKEYFEEYNFTLIQFTKLLKVPEMVYNLFKYETKQGEKSVFEFVVKYKVDEDLINNIVSMEKGDYLILNGEVIRNSMPSLVEQILKTHDKPLKYNDLYRMYMRMVERRFSTFSNLQESKIRNFISVCDRIPSSLTCNLSRIKYYDFAKHEFTQLLRVLDSYNLSIHISTELILRKLGKYLKSININDQYELHSLLRKLKEKDDRYVFLRMPMIQIGTLNKKEFIKREIEKNRLFKTKEILKYFDDNFGFDQKSLKTYLNDEFSDFTYNDIIRPDYRFLKDKQISDILCVMVNEIVFNDELLDILNRFTENGELYLNNYNIRKLGYLPFSGYCIKAEYKKAENYFRFLILRHDRLKLERHIDERIRKLTSFLQVLSSLVKNLDYVQIDEGYYVKVDSLLNSGINRPLLFNLIASIEDEIRICKFATIDTLDYVKGNSILETSGLDENILAYLLKNSSNLSIKKIGGKFLFGAPNSNDVLFDLIKSIINGKDNFKVYDIRKWILEKFNIDVEEEKIRTIVMTSNYYYSEEFDATFVSKKNYLKEVYNDKESIIDRV